MDARKFLRGVRIQGRPIERIELSSGTTLKIEELTDDEAVTYAKDIYIDFCGGVEGERGEIELVGVDQ